MRRIGFWPPPAIPSAPKVRKANAEEEITSEAIELAKRLGVDDAGMNMIRFVYTTPSDKLMELFDQREEHRRIAKATNAASASPHHSRQP